ncbi:MAG: hypothetical protein JKY62_16635 [Desulfocapsa sp.]|nr:hypothetical protein [Desulfocapsa sp.]
MGKVSESIFSGKTHVIPMADVCYLQRQKQLPLSKKPAPVWVIMKDSKYDYENGDWHNAPFLLAEEAASFTRCWCDYRAELESETLMDLTPDAQT